MILLEVLHDMFEVGKDPSCPRPLERGGSGSGEEFVKGRREEMTKDGQKRWQREWAGDGRGQWGEIAEYSIRNTPC